jgi:hypothetical protein
MQASGRVSPQPVSHRAPKPMAQAEQGAQAESVFAAVERPVNPIAIPYSKEAL